MTDLRLEVRITDEYGNCRKPNDSIPNECKLIQLTEYYGINEHMYPALAKQYENVNSSDALRALEIIACFFMKKGINGAMLKLDEIEKFYEEDELC